MLDSSRLNESRDQRKGNVAAGCATALAVLICLFGHLGALGLVGPDEPRYAWIARAMAQSGDWVTPRLFGSPWFEKPILYYWAAALGFTLHLPNEWAARLPSALAALAAAVCVAWIAAEFEESCAFCPWSPALLAPLFFSTCVASIGFTRAATPDMLFAASITLAMASAAVFLRHHGALQNCAGRTNAVTVDARLPALLGFGAFVGLGVLAKGPAAVVLAGGAMLLWGAAARQWRTIVRLLHPYAVASFCVVALPWYVECARRNPEFIRIFIFQHNFERYLTPAFQHRQPFWFFIPITFLAVLPWVAFLLPAARDGLSLWHQKAWDRSPAFFFVCWAFFPILFFSFSQSKLPGYILPAIPGLALVLAIGAARLIERESEYAALTFRLLGLTWIGLAAGGMVWLRRLPAGAAGDIHRVVLAGVVLAAVTGIAGVIFAHKYRRAAVWASLIVIALLVELGGVSILPELDPYYSARSIGELLRGDLRPERLFVYNFPRAWHWGLAFYLGRELKEWPSNDRAPALVVTTPKGLAEMKSSGYVSGQFDEPYKGVVLVPIGPRPPASAQH